MTDLTTPNRPRRALLSVYDKTDLVDLGRSLVELGWQLVSSGGTAATLAQAGVAVTDVAEVTGYPAILGHRVVTLHPRIHGGILADPSDESHRADMAEHGIEPFDLVVTNLYPFHQNPSVELIDIGGPAMVRAAAKNHAHVAIVTAIDQYPGVLAELSANGELSARTRRVLARAAFAHTAAYDAAIVAWLDELDPPADGLPATLHLALDRVQDLRYGENPHQEGARYRSRGARSWWDSARQHGGKELSYLNLYDTEAAWRLVWALGERPAAVVIKHANPCGVGVADDLAAAYRLAHSCDPVSAFGGIVAVNEPLTAEVAEALAPVFTEVVVAPGYEAAALEVLLAKKNLRVLEAPAPAPAALHLRSIDGGLLVQTPDRLRWDPASFRVATQRQPSAEEWVDLELAWRVCAAVTSNTIVLARGGAAVGIGAGQQNRRDAGRIATEKADGRARGGACASDAFFPFRDGLDAAAEAGATAVIQPGGSIRDDEVIAAADEHGMAMVFTGERHFKH
ncbi:MAG: bifunctional phosphoribosylaminoimidazolecarboxamide formyltransferase/IMP cyclohydrolase [Acidimicrobiia bacterium]|nr:bifunctional phosphoribosylaminoimidazolecarboxamide formyltransferase/IMP cyclohydrolase [Acidimicrobiia bacterium]